MSNNARNQNGFSIVEGLFAVVILGILGFTGWYVYQSTMVANKDYAAAGAAETSSSSLPAGWTWYTNKDLGFKYAYPKTWKVSNSTTTTCPAVASGIDATACPLQGSISPQSYIDYQTKKYGSLVSPLVTYWVFQKSDKSFDEVYSGYQFSLQPLDGYTPKPSSHFTTNGLKAFYTNQVNSSYSDNDYVVQLAPGTFVEFYNRESDKHYNPGGTTVDDQNDYTQFSPTVDQIIKTFSKA